ncbi:MAG: hypothetical protein WBO70_01225 [Erysipelotrichaceae bacterium]
MNIAYEKLENEYEVYVSNLSDDSKMAINKISADEMEEKKKTWFLFRFLE